MEPVIRTAARVLPVSPDGQVLVEHGTLFGAIEAGGADRITANPEARAEDEALDHAAMESGTD